MFGLLLLAIAVRPLTWEDLPEGLRVSLSPVEFARRTASADATMARRQREGEWDALIYYALQSRSLTNLPPIEPAVSARRFVESIEPNRRGCYLNGDCSVASQIPRDAMRIAALRKSAETGRAATFRALLRSGNADEEYRRTMGFLYRKEFGGDRAAYQDRGLSTDTSLVPSFTIWNSLQVLHALDPQWHIQRTLVIGPGLDVASRTQLSEHAEPQSYQPYLVAMSLRESRMADAPDIDCLDVNKEVVTFIDRFQTRPTLLLPPADPASDPAFRQWLAALPDELVVTRSIAESVNAAQGNLLTQRSDAEYDLIVITNVLLYFSDSELELAMGSIASMLKPGGYLIHNELRPAVEPLSSKAGLSAVAGRSLRIAPGLLDAFAIYRKRQ